MGAPKLNDEKKICPDELATHLASCTIFAGVEPAFLASAVTACEHLSFRAGESVILENEAHSCVYFVLSGTVEIASYLPDEKRIQRLALLKAGSHFGEFSVLTRSARSGSAYAHADSDLLKMSGEIFLSMLQASPVIAANLLRHLAKLTEQSLSSETIVPFYPETTPTLTSQILQMLPVTSWTKLSVVPLSLKANLLSVALKDPFNAAFHAHISREFPKLEVSVSIVGAERFNALLEAASASVGANAPAARTLLPQIYEPLAALKAFSLYSGFDDEYLTQLLPHLKTISVKAGSPILARGAQTDDSFVILSGSVLVARPISGTNAFASVMTLGAGDGFAESSVFLDAKSPCVFRAMEDTDLVAIPKSITQHLVSHLPFVVDFTRTLAAKLQALGHAVGLKYVAASTTIDVNRIAKLVPGNLIDEEKALPISFIDGEVTIGLLNPESSQTLLKFGRYFSTERLRIVGLTNDQYVDFRGQLKALEVSEAGGAVKLKSSTEKIDVTKWIDSVLLEGMRVGASDVHFEPGPVGLTTRFRIDGVLREYGKKLESEYVAQMVNRIKIMSNMDISVQHLPQDGHLESKTPSLRLMARVSTMPIKHGEKIVLRLIKERNSIVPLENIAPDRRIVKFLKSIADCRQGLFLVTGPTGSGKTTTLYSLLQVINQVGVNVISIEDPIEMEVGGINQVEINVKRGVDFAGVLRSVLRQDPDVVMVGEIRDAVSAKIVSEAAMTGHLVVSTLHSGTSFDAIPRLRELGLSSAQIAESLLGVITQRLVRKICKRCEKDHEITAAEAEMFTATGILESPLTVKRGDGCAACGNTGYSGRLPVFETWGNTRIIRDGIRQGLPTIELQALAREQGFEHLHEFGLRLVQSGLTTPEEIRRVLTGAETFL